MVFAGDVRVTKEDRVWCFPCGRWLDAKDGGTDVTLEVQPENEGGEAT